MIRGVFEPDPAVVPWILSSGSLGSEQGWCKRVCRLTPNIDPAILAFQVHIVAQMHAMLNRDARRLSRLPKTACRGRAA